MEEIPDELRAKIRTLLDNKMPTNDFETMVLFFATCDRFWPFYVTNKQEFENELSRLFHIKHSGMANLAGDVEKKIIDFLYDQVADEFMRGYERLRYKFSGSSKRRRQETQGGVVKLRLQ